MVVDRGEPEAVGVEPGQRAQRHQQDDRGRRRCRSATSEHGDVGAAKGQQAGRWGCARREPNVHSPGPNGQGTRRERRRIAWSALSRARPDSDSPNARAGGRARSGRPRRRRPRRPARCPRNPSSRRPSVTTQRNLPPSVPAATHTGREGLRGIVARQPLDPLAAPLAVRRAHTVAPCRRFPLRSGGAASSRRHGPGPSDVRSTASPVGVHRRARPRRTSPRRQTPRPGGPAPRRRTGEVVPLVPEELVGTERRACSAADRADGSGRHPGRA